MGTELIQLLKLAQGDRSLNAFARHADVSPGNLSRIMKGQKPTPEVLKKLAGKSHNGITYEQLMIAAGYVDANLDSTDKHTKSNETTIALHNENGYDENLPPEAKKELEDFIEFLKHKYGKNK